MKGAVVSSVTLILCTACGSADTGRVPIEGTVTYNGEPVQWGSITLRPTPGTKGPAAGTDIVDGKYRIPASAGPVTGSYIARITIVRHNRAEVPSQPTVKEPGLAVSLEMPIEVEADHGDYDFHLPAESE